MRIETVTWLCPVSSLKRPSRSPTSYIDAHAIDHSGDTGLSSYRPISHKTAKSQDAEIRMCTLSSGTTMKVARRVDASSCPRLDPCDDHRNRETVRPMQALHDKSYEDELRKTSIARSEVV